MTRAPTRAEIKRAAEIEAGRAALKHHRMNTIRDEAARRAPEIDTKNMDSETISATLYLMENADIIDRRKARTYICRICNGEHLMGERCPNSARYSVRRYSAF